MGNYYALELFSGVERQIFFSEKGLPPSEFLTVFRPCDRAYPSFPSGFEESDDPYIPSHAYVLSVPKLTERLEVMGFTVPRLEEHVKRCLNTDRAERCVSIRMRHTTQKFTEFSPCREAC